MAGLVGLATGRVVNHPMALVLGIYKVLRVSEFSKGILQICLLNVLIYMTPF